MSEDILKKYDEMQPIYTAFTQKTEILIKELLGAASINVQDVGSRTKSRESLANKLTKDGGEKYQKLEDITDLSGIRITCWFLDQITPIEEIIKKNFKVFKNLSVDKRKIMDPDRFGYVSVHYIVTLSAEREGLGEFSRYTGLFCEVQIRTILQHAWAEIEHDLGYKSKTGIPRSIQRRFYRLAGLLELADAEFQGLKNDTANYSNEVSEKIKRNEQNIVIDKVSLESYIKTSEIVGKLDNIIVGYFGADAKLQDLRLMDSNLRLLAFWGIDTINKLDSALKENSENIIVVAKKWLTARTPGSVVVNGICIFYLGYVLATKTRDLNKIQEYISIFNFPQDQKVPERLFQLSKELFPS